MYIELVSAHTLIRRGLSLHLLWFTKFRMFCLSMIRSEYIYLRTGNSFCTYPQICSCVIAMHRLMVGERDENVTKS